MTTTTEAARHAWKIARNAQKPGGKAVESGGKRAVGKVGFSPTKEEAFQHVTHVTKLVK